MKGSRGLTLLEILISAAIIGVSFLGILSAVQFGNKSTVKISNYSKALRIAQEFIEEFKHNPLTAFLKDPDVLNAEDWFEANIAKYCPKTKTNVEGFKAELKSLAFDPQIKVVKSNGVVRDILLRVNVDWKEGDGTTEGNKNRQIRLVNSLHNTGAD